MALETWLMNLKWHLSQLFSWKCTVSCEESLLRNSKGKVTEPLPENLPNPIKIWMHIRKHSVTTGSQKSITPLLLCEYSLGLRFHIHQLEQVRKIANVMEKWILSEYHPILRRCANSEKEIQNITLHCFPRVYVELSLFNLMPIFPSSRLHIVGVYLDSFLDSFT